MADDNSPREKARRFADDLVDYAIYAPLGAVATLAEELPELVRRGRDRFGGQVRLAQMFGRIAADSARRQAQGFARGRPGTERVATERQGVVDGTPPLRGL